MTIQKHLREKIQKVISELMDILNELQDKPYDRTYTSLVKELSNYEQLGPLSKRLRGEKWS